MKRRVVHDVALNDDRYALVTVEGVASEPGTVEATTGGLLVDEATNI